MEIFEIGSNNKKDNVMLSKAFRKNYFSDREILEETILITDIIFQVITDLKNNMFFTNPNALYDPKDRESNQLKIDLWGDITGSDANVLKKIYKISDFKKNRDKNQITKALEFLKHYQYREQKFTNRNGKEIIKTGGFIDNWFYSKQGYFEIQLSLYWANLIVEVEQGKWNRINFNVLEDFKNNKQRHFVMWLSELKLDSGTVKKVEDFIEFYGLNYKTKKELKKEFFLPIKNKLDNKAINPNWISFNVVDDENFPNSVRIVPYLVKPLDDLENDPLKKHPYTYKLKYVQKRNKLSSADVKKIRILYSVDQFELLYEKYKETVKLENKKVTAYVGEEFLIKIESLKSSL